MYEVYQDHPKQAKLNVRVVLAIAFLICAIGTGIFLITRLVSKPLSKEEARAQTGIVYDSSAVEGGWDNLSPEEIAEKLNEKVAEGMINISMNTAPYFENGTAEGNVMIVKIADVPLTGIHSCYKMPKSIENKGVFSHIRFTMC